MRHFVHQPLEQYDGLDIQADGVIDKKTKGAIKQYQTDNNLKIDGDPGPNTWAQMQNCERKKIWEQIKVCGTALPDQTGTQNPMHDDVESDTNGASNFECVFKIKLLAEQEGGTDTKFANAKAT